MRFDPTESQADHNVVCDAGVEPAERGGSAPNANHFSCPASFREKCVRRSETLPDGTGTHVRLLQPFLTTDPQTLVSSLCLVQDGNRGRKALITSQSGTGVQPAVRGGSASNANHLFVS
eukprot:TRINITY_DN25264_c0_g2_i3.p2 TRINITY_DN25264_c0_g2~~TRINITY_DN25264_c0_g2_i3.p2  ORF type:complete len:119 (+),score=8.84 TRINITY_DN25264_c0_g2_i3:235-591(+)